MNKNVLVGLGIAGVGAYFLLNKSKETQAQLIGGGGSGGFSLPSSFGSGEIEAPTSKKELSSLPSVTINESPLPTSNMGVSEKSPQTKKKSENNNSFGGGGNFTNGASEDTSKKITNAVTTSTIGASVKAGGVASQSPILKRTITPIVAGGFSLGQVVKSFFGGNK